MILLLGSKYHGTNINYPVVQADNNSYYLDHSYKKTYSARGSLFLDKDVSLTPASHNFLIYGHRNKSGEMFENLLNYEKEDFYKEHKTLNFTTLTEDTEYEVLAAFRSRVYYQSERNVFRYYYFINAKNEHEYNDFISNSKSASLYNTGVTAKYGDNLITLSTCAYHTEDRKICSCCKEKIVS